MADIKSELGVRFCSDFKRFMRSIIRDITRLYFADERNVMLRMSHFKATLGVSNVFANIEDC